MGRLTPRQREVVALLATGLQCKQVGARLGIAERTVRRHIEDIVKGLPGEAPPIRRILKNARDLMGV